jgi:acetyl esterase/lipase
MKKEKMRNTLTWRSLGHVQAVQDAKAAVRFLRAHKSNYKIDDTKIMLGGTSAGGALSLHYA